MNPINSIRGRIDSFRNDIKSRYWEYIKYYEDGIIWEKSILLEAFGGKSFQGNPYYLYQKIINDERFINYDIYISSQNPDMLEKILQAREELQLNVKIVKTGSNMYRQALSHCKYLINNVSFTMDFIKKSKQVYINTWHGTPLKCLGRNIQNDPFECNNTQRNFLLSDILVAPNQLTKKVFEYDYMVKDIMPGKICLQGYPRNAVFFNENHRLKIKRKYNLDGFISIMYMPTWRGTANGIDSVDQISDIERVAKALGEKYKVYVKFHPAMSANVEKMKYCYSVPEEIEIYTFLNGMDMLITDYSSVFFDYSNTGNPIVLYQYDQNEYYKNRGIYKEVGENIPFPIAHTYEELYKLIIETKPKLEDAFVKMFCKYDSLFASNEILDIMFETKQCEKEHSVDLYIINFPISDDKILKWAEQLKGSNYRFVFLQNRKFRKGNRITSWNELFYLCAYTYSRLRMKEKFYEILFKFIKTKKLESFIKGYQKREQKRLWGDIVIGHIYAQNKNLPVSLKYSSEVWPEYLK